MSSRASCAEGRPPRAQSHHRHTPSKRCLCTANLPHSPAVPPMPISMRLAIATTSNKPRGGKHVESSAAISHPLLAEVHQATFHLPARASM
mmetsp:Transcript_9957/g.30539  ORF Transcript_9957/g.30539 Transcript_9957/m.30539 type:complete len:91 (-) Transcript_9957:49-321(-)|eukprot:scaffold137175_cov30-Tisochrysis_lutea.AAC.10